MPKKLLCRGTRRRIGGASRLCQVARSCSYVLDGLRSWLRDRCSVLGVNRREGPLSEGSDRGKIENGGCASLARVSSRARWAPRSRSLDPRLLRRSRLLESLALAFDRSSLGIANRRSVRGFNYVNRNLSKQEEKSPDKVKVSWQPSEMWSVENICCTANLQSESEHSTQANHKQAKTCHSVTITTCSKEKTKKKETSELPITNSTTSTRLNLGSIRSLPDLYSGLALGLISGWKPPNARMAWDFSNSDAWLAVMAQRAGCTAFNPWHKGLPGSVWKHQLWFIWPGPSLKVHPAGMT